MYNIILVRYGDLTLKGKNKKRFIEQVVFLLREKINNPTIRIEQVYNRLYIHLNGEPQAPVLATLSKVSGIRSYSLVLRTDCTLESIEEKALDIIRHRGTKPSTFKVKTKRSDKRFPMTSQAVSRHIGGLLLKHYPHLSVDVHQPDFIFQIEIRQHHTYLYADKIQGLGGYPTGIAGKGVLMLSGGIDSPVAGFLAMKQGVEIEAFHFESTPLTSIESVQKAIDLTKKLAHYAPHSTITLHLVPFRTMHEAIIQETKAPYWVTLMRRMMVRIASRYAETHHMSVLINGESIGQVASQTLESMRVVDHVTRIPIIRPLATVDKNDIVDLSRTIDCYEISIRPFEDCCTIYLPKHPTTSPRVLYAIRYEKLFDYAPLIDTCLDTIVTLRIHKDDTRDITQHGLTVNTAIEAMKIGD